MSLIRPALVALALSCVVSAPALAKGDPAKGQPLSAACGACHGADGNSAIPVNPNLAQQHPDYIAKQLAEFKSGARANAIMAGIATGLSPENMADLGAWFGSRKVRAATASDEAAATAGQKLYRAGDASRGLPACSGCHSPSGAGIPSQYPRLAGQHQAYTVAQLKAFKAGERANDNAALMRTIAAKLTDQELTALAEYVAALRP
ncbi:MAG: cytochrome c4 [Burkholderiales bacterium]|nr:cytochrome c4 [Burkholderiales bacterium]